MCSDRKLTKRGIKRVMRFLENLKNIAATTFQGNLSFRQNFKVCMENADRTEVFFAVIENVPNPVLGAAPCCREKPLVLISQNFKNGKLSFHAIEQVWDNQEIKQFIKDELAKIKQNSKIQMLAFTLSCVRVMPAMTPIRR